MVKFIRGKNSPDQFLGSLADNNIRAVFYNKNFQTLLLCARNSPNPCVFRRISSKLSDFFSRSELTATGQPVNARQSGKWTRNKFKLENSLHDNPENG